MTTLFGSNKGNFQTYAIGIFFLVSLALTIIVIYLITSQFFDTWDTTGLVPTYSALLKSQYLGAIHILDKVFVVLVIIVLIAIGVTTYRLATAPVYFIIEIFMVAFLGFVSYIMNYFFSQVISQASFDAVRGLFPNIILLCTNLHWIALAMFIIGSIALYGKKEQGQEGYVQQ